MNNNTIQIKQTIANFINVDNKQELKDILNEIISAIDNEGHLEVEGIVRRWGPAQCLNMLRGDLKSEGASGFVYCKPTFHQSLMQKGYKYVWNVLANETNVLYKMYKDGDMDAFEVRNQFFNKEVVFMLAEQFMAHVVKNIDKLSQYSIMSILEDLGVSCTNPNECKTALINVTMNYQQAIRYTNGPKDVHKATMRFQKLVHAYLRGTMGSRVEKLKVPNEFANVYKAAGAYYTMKDLILFEGYRFRDGGETVDASLRMLETVFSNIANEYNLGEINALHDNGYKMMGVLKDFLIGNNYDYVKMVTKWAAQSKERRQAIYKNRANRRARF